MKPTLWIEIVNGWDRKVVAGACGTTYEAVRQWSAGMTRPRGKNRERLLGFARSQLPPKKYAAFRASLAADLLGELASDSEQ